MQKLALIVLTGLGSLSLAGLSTLVPTVAVAETFSKAVGEPLKRAQAAIQKRQWDVALGEIKKAQAVPDKKPHEEYAANEMLAYVLLQQKDNAGAAKVYEAQLNSGRTPEAQVGQRVKTITQLYVGARNWPKAIEYGNRWVKTSPGDPDAQFQLAQAYYSSGDYKNASKIISGALDASRKAGQQPKENWLNMKLDAQSKIGDKAGMVATREQLVRYYPSKNNWKAVIVNVQNQPDNGDAATLSLFRLMNEIDVLDKPDDYVEMAQMLIETGASPEAVTVLEKGFANKTLEGKDKDRHVRLLNNAKAQATTAAAAISKADQDARAAATGDADVNLGGRYLAAGDAQKAVEAVQRGLKKGGVKAPDEAQMVLGRAYLKLKQKDQARKAFSAVPDDSKLATVAQLWSLVAAQS